MDMIVHIITTARQKLGAAGEFQIIQHRILVYRGTSCQQPKITIEPGKHDLIRIQYPNVIASSLYRE